uniref:F-box domain-containing protein n=1 Tax=Leersia perrieri TaxID=77586 RepID=A0A0D9XCI2_9ORYZ
MAKGIRRRRHKNKAYKKSKGETTINDLPDDLLDLILLRVDSPLCLVRATFACKRFFRLIADERFGSPAGGRPVVLGHYYDPGLEWSPLHRISLPSGDPPFVPSSLDAFDGLCFSLDFLPFDQPRQLIDSRGSLLLFKQGPWGGMYQHFPDLIVCEPLTCRFQGIAHMPAPIGSMVFGGAYLIAGENTDGGMSMSNYRVFCVVGQLACVFSPGSDGGWRFVPVPDDDDDDGGEFHFPDDSDFAGRVAGKIYWGALKNGQLQVLDESTVTFSTMHLPEHMWWAYNRSNFRVIGGMESGGLSGGGEWVVEKSVRLADTSIGLPGHKAEFFTLPAKIVTAGDGFVTLTTQEDETWVFSVDLETMELEREHARNRYVAEAHPYALPQLPSFLPVSVN